jgi:hypothetical protein
MKAHPVPCPARATVAGGANNCVAGSGAAASVRRPTTLAVCGRVRYRERDPRFLARRLGLDTGARAIGLDGGGVSKPTEGNLRSIVRLAHQRAVRRG